MLRALALVTLVLAGTSGQPAARPRGRAAAVVVDAARPPPAPTPAVLPPPKDAGGRPLYVVSAEAPVATLPGGAPDFPALARRAQPSVVSITATGSEDTLQIESEDPSAREFFERFYGGAEPPTKGMASGFVIREDGYILTNEHVVSEAAALAVTFGDDDGHSYAATVVGRDELSDLALLKIDAGRPLPALALGDSEGIGVGDWVTAIGNPFGLSHSLTVGVVSFIGRRDINPSGRPGYYDFIQTDASINPGNSGGPLIDRHGRVIGISAAVNATGQGIGFAIPVNMAKDVLPALYEKGSLRRSFLGVSIQDLSPDLAESFGVKVGVVVTEVSPGSPARSAGLAVGDVITSLDGAPIARAYRLRWLASNAGVGAKVRIGYSRAGASKDVEVALGALPGASGEFHRVAPVAPREELRPFGFKLGGAGSDGRGLRITEVDPVSQAYAAGLREGDVVLQAGERTVKSSKDLSAGNAKGVLRLLIQRGLRPMFIAFRP